MPNDSTTPTIATPAPKSRGWRRYRELKQQDDTDRQAIAAELLAGLGRPSTMADRLAAENIASLAVWARTLERRGAFKGATEVRQQITQAARAFPAFKPQPALPPKGDAGAAFLAEMQAAATPQGAE